MRKKALTESNSRDPTLNGLKIAEREGINAKK